MTDFGKLYTVRLIGLLLLFAGASSAIFNNLTYRAYQNWDEGDKLEQSLAHMTDAPMSAHNVAAMQSYILKNTFSGKNDQLQQHLFNSLAAICDSTALTLSDFSVFDSRTDGERIQIITTKVSVEGDFQKILNVIYTIEKTLHGTAVSSSVFYVTHNPRTKSRKLRCDIYLQSILKKS
jgi:hypothetical protein